MCRTYVLVQFMLFPSEYEHLPDLLIPGYPILIFGFYFWDVVYSVYRDLKREEDSENIGSWQEVKSEEHA